jgi:hypothetical protein
MMLFHERIWSETASLRHPPLMALLYGPHLWRPPAIDGTTVRATFMAPTRHLWRPPYGDGYVGAINVARTVVPSMAGGS